MSWIRKIFAPDPFEPPQRQDVTWWRDTRPLTLRPWHDDPQLTAEQKRIIQALLALPRSKQRRAYRFIRDIAKRRAAA